jgi:hypothetical protein
VMGFGFPSRNRLVAIPETFDLQTSLVIRTAAMAIVDGALVLETAFTHASQRLLFFFIQLERGRIDAITQMAWRRTIVEDMTQMRIAFTA